MIKYELFNQICVEKLETDSISMGLPISNQVCMVLIATALSLLDTKVLGPEGGVGSI